MMKRDLKADLELCNKATPGPWSTIDRLSKYVTNTGEVKSFTREQFIQSEQETICTTYKPKNKHNAEFIAEAREGWSHAIERAIKAETLARELVAALRRISEILDNATCRCRCGFCEYFNAQKIAEKSLAKAKEVLGDE